MLAHVIARHFDEKHADAVADTARAAVQHKPYLIALIEADFDKMIAGPQRTQMIHIIAAVELWILLDKNFVAVLQLAPHADLPLRQLAPCSPITTSPIVGAPMRNRFINRRAQPF